MQVQRMVVARFVGEDETIATSSPQRLRLVTWIETAAIDRPSFLAVRDHTVDRKRYRFIRPRGYAIVTEQAIIPARARRFHIRCHAAFSGILHDNAETCSTDIGIRRTENPYARILHLDEGIHAFRRAEFQHADSPWIRHRISI